ncbi:hypothetical protein [Streptomyces paludis]|uniref:Uncharacterized protein n=1 Tax=Streptomyces paludis TaxID=2282738 RepID=A0A345HSE4_9ACTN|nr:hypothetical protein [Streptomyces paludis]AXG79618.1 hypothetical protein DVK44_20400 [Streptomyces paludis]
MTKTPTPTPTDGTGETDGNSEQQWLDRLELRLALAPGMTREITEDILAEVTAHCAETGQHPEDAFGPADEFAAQTARERVPVAERARRDRSDRLPGDFWKAGLTTLSALLGVYTYNVMRHDGLWFHVTAAGLTGILLLAATVQAVWMAKGLYAAGRIRATALAGAGTAVLIAGAFAAFALLPDASLARLPSPLLALAALAPLGLLWLLNRRSAAAVTGPEDTTAPTDPINHDGSTDPTDPEDWLRLLGGLLTGRHKVPGRRSRELVAEARGHLAATGGSPAEEFGPVEVYALQLAEQSGPRVWWSRASWQTALLTALLLAYVVTATVKGDFGWRFWVAAVGLAGSALFLAAELTGDKKDA